MSCIIGICDDEISACSQLENIVIDISGNIAEEIEVYVWKNGKDFIEDISDKIRPDILFLDIEMDGYNGIQVGEYIRKELEDMDMNIIYISSKTSYAMNLFKLHPFDFVVKPFNRDGIEKIIAELMKLRGLDKGVFLYQSHKKSYRVALGNILYFESDKKNINIIANDGIERQFREKLKNITEKLPYNFVMINQSYIINVKHIRECSSSRVILDNGDELNISRSYKDIFSRTMLQYRQFDF